MWYLYLDESADDEWYKIFHKKIALDEQYLKEKPLSGSVPY